MNLKPKFKKGDIIINDSKFWHGLPYEHSNLSDKYDKIGIEGIIIEYCGIFPSYGSEEKAHIYIVQWSEGGKCSKSEHQLKPSYKTLEKWRYDKINLIVNEDK